MKERRNLQIEAAAHVQGSDRNRPRCFYLGTSAPRDIRRSSFSGFTTSFIGMLPAAMLTLKNESRGKS